MSDAASNNNTTSDARINISENRQLEQKDERQEEKKDTRISHEDGCSSNNNKNTSSSTSTAAAAYYHSRIVQAVSEYSAQEASVIPMKYKGKKPALESWTPYQHRRPNDAEIKLWFEDNKQDRNVGIVTGAVSGVLALDSDGKTARGYTQNIIENRLSPDTRQALNNTIWEETGGGGLHILIGYDPQDFPEGDPSAIEIETAKLWRGKGDHEEITLLGNRHCIVVAPSVHENGKEYKRVRGSKIQRLSKLQVLEVIRALRSQLGDANKKKKVELQQQKQQAQDQSSSITTTTGTAPLQRPAPLSPNLTDEQIMDIAVILKPNYIKGQRNDFVLYLSGWLRKEGITAESARKVIVALAADDEQLKDRLLTLQYTYEKENLDEVKGYAGLLETLEGQLGSADIARQVLKEVRATFPEKAIDNKGNSGDSGGLDGGAGGGNKPPSAAEITIDLVDRRAALYFNDEYGTPYIRVRVGEHTETMPVDSRRFELYVSKVYYDEMGRQVLKAESLNEVIRILTARTIFDSITAKLHLRSAWGIDATNAPDYSTLYYDPTTQSWSCIKVTTYGWEILPRHPEGVLFTRFKQLPQAMPIKDYSPDVMDKYLDLMHIKGHADRLLVKVLLIASFIPDIGHPVTVPNGEKGGVKSTYCRYHKRLVDPCAVELLTIPKDRNEFVQHMHHNVVVVYDNVRIVPKWFSDEICKAVTGAGSSKRKFYTDDDDVAYNYKRCIAVNGINNVLTEPDALDRSVMLDFTRISDKQRREEVEVDAEFNAMKPGLATFSMFW